jgi:hypothetical protein
MPCNSDYLEPNQSEIHLAKIEALLEELQTGKLPKWYGNGGHYSVYNQASDERLHLSTVALCAKLQDVPDIKVYSLEMQLWWREHQEADAKRLEKEIQQFTDKEKALAKLSDYERKLLGL